MNNFCKWREKLAFKYDKNKRNLNSKYQRFMLTAT